MAIQLSSRQHGGSLRVVGGRGGGPSGPARKPAVETGLIGVAAFLAAVTMLFLATNPHAAFFYVLTATHGLHLLGGVVALTVVLFRTWRGRYTPQNYAGVTHCGIYWHFMDLLWMYLFVLLFWV